MDWFFNEVLIDTAGLPDGSFQIDEAVQGRSILTLDLNILWTLILGPNSIRCSASNFAGTIAGGTVTLIVQQCNCVCY